MEIKIACEGNTLVSLAELSNLQGELKTLSEADYVKLRNSITEFGFSFPVFFWQDKEGKKWILDAHQRIRTLNKMQSEGWTIPKLPADPIYADNKTEAKKKLLLLNSRYGQMTDTGLADFLNEEDSSFLIEDVSDYLTFPELGFDKEEQNKGAGNKEPEEVECPRCFHKFTI